MKIGIPLEIMTGEGRVALTPDACKTLVAAGHTVYIQQHAGLISGYSDAEYVAAGVRVIAGAEALYAATRLIVKVKQPLPEDIRYLKDEHTVFGYFHLAADPALVQTLCDSGITAIPFESVRDADGHLPLLAPMSQVAGRIATMRGASLLFRNRGGRGVLLGGVDGSESGRVLVLGAGVAGSHAVAVAVALGAQVDVLDLNESKLQQLKQQYPVINTHLSTPEQVEQLSVQADVVVGAVLLAGRRAPVVLKQSMIRQMNEGSVIVDIAIDQGGCVQGIEQTSSEQLCYLKYGVIHSAVPNMPAAVPRTASQSLSSAILPYVQTLADYAVNQLPRAESGLAQALYRAIAIENGAIVDTVLQAEMESGKIE